ncbi:MAG: AAA family ATPase [Minisyncoccota bacterium]
MVCIDAEQQLLGHVLLSSSLNDIQDLEVEDLYRESHRLIFKACRDLARSGRAVSPTTVAQLLLERGQLVRVGDRPYLHSLVGQAALKSHVPDLITIISQAAMQRREREHAHALQCALESGDVEQIMKAERGMRDFFREVERGEAGLDVYEVNDLAERQLPVEKEYISEGILPRESVWLVSAYAKSYKTMLALNAALCLASGEPFLGWDVPDPVPVLYIQEEINIHTMQNRIRRMIRAMECQVPFSNLHIVQGRGLKLTRRGGWKRVRKLLAKYHPDVVFFDPLYKFHDGEENSAKEMKALLDRFDDLIEEFGCSIVVVHHHGKPSKERSTGAAMIRGSSVILDYVDTSMRLERTDQPKVVKASFTLRNGEDPEEMELELDGTSLWLLPRGGGRPAHKPQFFQGTLGGPLSDEDLEDMEDDMKAFTQGASQ